MKEVGRFLEEDLTVEFGLPANICTRFGRIMDGWDRRRQERVGQAGKKTREGINGGWNEIAMRGEFGAWLLD